MSDTSKETKLVKDAGYVASVCCSGLKGTSYDEQTEVHSCTECHQGYKEAPQPPPVATQFIPDADDRAAMLQAISAQGDPELVAEFLALNSDTAVQMAV